MNKATNFSSAFICFSRDIMVHSLWCRGITWRPKRIQDTTFHLLLDKIVKNVISNLLCVVNRTITSNLQINLQSAIKMINIYIFFEKKANHNENNKNFERIQKIPDQYIDENMLLRLSYYNL